MFKFSSFQPGSVNGPGPFLRHGPTTKKSLIQTNVDQCRPKAAPAASESVTGPVCPGAGDAAVSRPAEEDYDGQGPSCGILSGPAAPAARSSRPRAPAASLAGP
jgi:hypothetical protein